MSQYILIIDCGATNIRAVLVDPGGRISAMQSVSNNTVEDPQLYGGLVWDVEDIWRKMSCCCRKVAGEMKPGDSVSAVAVTTFGVDGAPVNKDGNLLYPVISWQCARTMKPAENIEKYFNRENLYSINGLQSYHYNTLFKIIWFYENHPEILDKMDRYLFIPSIITYRMTGEMANDITMAGTSMLTSITDRNFDDTILRRFGIKREVFMPVVEPGAVVGKLKNGAAADMGLLEGIPVVAAGHDTQFAVFGAGADENEPVLSSGTWEILMARSRSTDLKMPSASAGVSIELDAEKGLLNPSTQWVASGVLEWAADLFYSNLQSGPSKYEKMIDEAGKICPGCDGVRFLPELYPGGGLTGKKGIIEGLKHNITRGHIYRAALEALAVYAKFGLKRLEAAAGFRAGSVLCVGGGSKNRLWNQIRADVLGIPVKTNERKETTVLGAACFAMAAAGWYKSPAEASNAMGCSSEIFQPDKDSELYQKIYDEYIGSYFRKE